MEISRKVITVSKQAGSGGTYVGHEVAKALGYSYVDREILRRAARFLNRDTESVEEYEGKSSGFIQNFMRTFALEAPEVAYVPKELPVYDKDLFVLENKIINDIVDKHNAVIIGRGGFHLLKDHPNTIHLLIYAPRNYRVERIMKADSITDIREAQTRIDESDRKRAKFIRDMVGTDWTDARNYNLCIDTSVVGVSESARTIIDFARKALR